MAMSNMSNLVRLTDDSGTAVRELNRQPHPGSVVLTSGAHGTAWQRHASDGLWHCTVNGATLSWFMLCRRRNLMLAYDAPPVRVSV